jgi:hypothetical protein
LPTNTDKKEKGDKWDSDVIGKTPESISCVKSDDGNNSISMISECLQKAFVFSKSVLKT